MPTDRLRAVLRRHASSVVVVTAAGPPPVGCTVTSFTSVSLEPPLVSFCLDRTASAWPTVAIAEYVGLHILAAGQEQVARTFAEHGADRFGPDTPWHPGPFGLPLLDGVLGWLAGRIVARVPAGDHTIVIAEPLAGAPGDDAPALVYHRRHYQQLSQLDLHGFEQMIEQWVLEYAEQYAAQ